ncbi:COG1355, Predicted dioxygenase [hydrothermal vent metagenome]|uniref:COG1355, Predicted dioxygenase n=1 Tax=hydrothermal vent metagenome TaxID=652676 RepID=A0A1W1EB69_9ZZZZ
MSARETAVAGQFYPASGAEIEKMIEHYNTILDAHANIDRLFSFKSRAVIVPHAGYVYSGFTANVALRLLGMQEIKRVVVIGPSHRVYLKGVSVAEYDSYETPFGALRVDTALVAELKAMYGADFYPQAHQEHSTEVQMPLIKYYMPDVSVVELVYEDASPTKIAEMIDYLLDDGHTAVVISTDLSHYYDIQKAKQLDSICLDAVMRLDVSKLHQGCEACGKIGVESMLIAARHKGLKPHILDYRTSADASGDTSQVVGYTSIAFTKED